MYFKEKNEEIPIVNVVNAVEIDDENNTSVSSNQALFGIHELSSDITSLLKKVATIYGKTIDFKSSLSKKNSIIKGAITQTDVQSMIKIISHDVDDYLKQINLTANRLRRSYLELDNKMNIVLTRNEMDEKYKSIFSETFFNKTLNIHMDKLTQEDVDSGIFLIKFEKKENKSDVFIKNTYKSIFKDIYSELRYLDVIAHIGDDIFAVLIVDVDRSKFETILKKIIEKIELNGLEKLVSAGMLNQFDNNNSTILELKDTLLKVKEIKDDYMFV